MKIKIGKFMFDPNQTPIMLVLSKQDKANIAAHPEANSYAAFPDGYNKGAVENWMADENFVEIDAFRLEELEEHQFDE